MLKTTCYALIAAALMAGCSTGPQPSQSNAQHKETRLACWSEQEQIQERIRTYPGLSEGQILQAVERLLNEAGGKQIRVVQRSPHGLTAQYEERLHNQSPFLEARIEAWQWWEVRTRPGSQGTELCIQAMGTWQAESTGPLVKGKRIKETLAFPASLGDPKAVAHKTAATPSRAVNYATFWERMDRQLGKATPTRRCQDIYGRSGRSDRFDPSTGRLVIDPLCQLPLFDKAQAEALPSATQPSP